MSEHLSKIQLAAYGGRTLGGQELLAVDRHLAACDVCYERFTRILRSSSDLYRSQHHGPSSQSIEEPFHLDYDQHLAPYADDKSNDIDREIVESHVALCSECADDLRDLQEFRQQSVQELARHEHAIRRPPWKRWLVQWQRPLLWNRRFSAPLVIALFVLGLMLAVLLWMTHRSPRSLEQAGNTTAPELDKGISPVNNASASTRGPTERPTDKTAQEPPRPKEDRADQRNRNLQREEAVIIALNDGGGQVTLNQRGEVEGLGVLPPDVRQDLTRVLTSRQFHVTPALADLKAGAGRLRGVPDEQNTLLPVVPIGVVIESDRPTFRWRALEGAGDYVVAIYDPQLHMIENSGPLVGTEWTTPRPLPRGITYSWQITTVKDNNTVISPIPPAGEARFKVLDREAIPALENARRLHGSSHLVMGVIYWKRGLLVEAEREFQALAVANPKSPVAAELLERMRSLGPR